MCYGFSHFSGAIYLRHSSFHSCYRIVFRDRKRIFLYNRKQKKPLHHLWKKPLNSSALSYVKDMEEALKKARPDRVFITHSGCDTKIVNAVRSYLESLGVFQEILETRAGGVVSSHCGPGTLGVLFIAKE